MKEVNKSFMMVDISGLKCYYQKNSCKQSTILSRKTSTISHKKNNNFSGGFFDIDCNDNNNFESIKNTNKKLHCKPFCNKAKDYSKMVSKLLAARLKITLRRQISMLKVLTNHLLCIVLQIKKLKALRIIEFSSSCHNQLIEYLVALVTSKR